VFLDERRVGNPVNPANQSLSGALARYAGGLDAAQPWWIGAAVVTGLAGLAVAGWAHRRGHRLAAVTCCGLTGLLVSPFSWTHHWVWAWPLLVALAVTAWQRRSPDSQNGSRHRWPATSGHAQQGHGYRRPARLGSGTAGALRA
jgi:alpha-1,2-mannosyltransferase